jgi:hypothetical protein
MHQLTHLFSDIRRKGTCENFSCVIGEGFHQGLIKAYESSNKKNVAQQVRFTFTRYWPLIEIYRFLKVKTSYLQSAVSDGESMKVIKLEITLAMTPHHHQ